MNQAPKTYIEVSQENGKKFLERQIQGKVTMLNLLKFHEQANYNNIPELAPPEAISGRAAYELYMAHSLPYLEEAESKILINAKGGRFLIGPTDEYWDTALLVSHKSVESFMAFASNEGYLAGIGHRKAALADSRLLPLELEKSMNQL